MKPIVVVQNVSKKYSRNSNSHLSYGIRDLFREVFGRKSSPELRQDEFLAVDDISFTLYPGDSIALVGRNGSGKTTLLKMMNGLIKLDQGMIIIEGRTQALINLGAGFNPALSGRDNILNSASLMGLNRKESLEILDEIIEFSELEDFIDSPIGTYSSGMKARLGFSVAIHLNPDILLIDEILSVGDYAFQNKCFVKMHQLKKQGVTIVLVSHSHTQVLQICERALWMHNGKMMQLGPAQETVKAYLDFLEQQEVSRIEELNRLKEETKVKFEDQKNKRPALASLVGALYTDNDRVENIEVSFRINGKEGDTIAVHQSLEIEYSFDLVGKVTDLNVSLVLITKDGQRVAAISTLNGDLVERRRSGRVHCTVTIPDFNLCPGTYYLVMPIHEGQSYLWRDVVKEFTVVSRNKFYWHIVDLTHTYVVHDS